MPTDNNNALLIGQSFIVTLAGGAALATFSKELSRLSPDPVVYNYSRNGSSITKRDAPAAQPNWYFYNEDTKAAGPLLIELLAYIATIPAASKPWRVGVGIGESSSVVSSPNPALYIEGMTFVINAVKAALHGANTGIIAMIIGRRLTTNPLGAPGVQMIREAQLKMCEPGAWPAHVFEYGCDVAGLKLLGEDPREPNDVLNSHFDAMDEAALGYRFAQRFLQSFGYLKPRNPPNVGIISYDGTYVYVPITSSTPISHPASPSHIVIRDDDGFPNLEFEWSSANTLRIKPDRALVIPSARLLTNYGDLNNLVRDGLICDVHRQELRSLSVAIPPAAI